MTTMISRCFLLIVLFLVSPVEAGLNRADVEPKPNLVLSVDGKDIEMRLPVIKYQGQYLIPMSEWLRQVDGQWIRRRKQDRFEWVVSPQKTVYLVPNSRQFYINEQCYFFQAATVWYHNDLYVPIKTLAKLLDMPITQSKQRIALTLPSHQVSALKSWQLLKRVKRYWGQHRRAPRVHQAETQLAPFNLKRPVKMMMGKQVLAVNDALYYDQYGLLMINIETLASLFNSPLTRHEQAITLRHKGQTLRLRRNSPWIQINESERLMPSAVRQKGSGEWVPFEALMRHLNVPLTRHRIKQVIYALTEITAIHVNEEKGQQNIVIQANDHIQVLPIKQGFFHQGISIDIPNSYPSKGVVPLKLNTGQTGLISEVVPRSIKGHTTRIRLKSIFPLPEPTIRVNKDEVRVVFQSKINRIQPLKTPHYDLIELSGRGNLVPIRHRLSDNKTRLSLRFEETISRVPELIYPRGHIVKEITTQSSPQEASQTHIQLTFKSPIDEYEIITSNRVLQIRLSSPQAQQKMAQLSQAPKTSGFHPIKLLKRGKHQKVILIDAGHGGKDPGAVAKGSYEKKYTLDVATRVKKQLSKKGYKVIMSRKSDRYVSLRKRAQSANKAKADLMVSVHFNSYKSSKAQGTETYYYKRQDKKLAQLIQAQLNHELKLKNNGVRRARLYVLRHSHMPSVLVEPAFMTNPKEFKLIKSSTFRQNVADAIVTGIDRYFGIK